MGDDPDYLDWFVWHHRLTSSPSSWVDFRRMQIDLDVGDALPAIRVPTLVLSKEQERPDSEQVASRIPGAEFIVVPGIGRAIQENQFAVEAVETFLAGSPARRIPDTVLATVLFTDLVNSTQRAAELGDRDWREPARATPRARADGARALQGRRDRHCRRRVLRELRRPGPRDLVRARDRASGPGARPRGARRDPHRRMRAEWGTSSPAWP